MNWQRKGIAFLQSRRDPPRPDSAALIQSLDGLGVRTLMVTGDSAVTAAAIARKVGLPDTVCPADRLQQQPDPGAFSVFARVLPEDKFRLVKILQDGHHTVGMCGDGANDAPALRQAQVGIAVSSATDVAKAAAAMVLTEPGLGGVVAAVQEGRSAFQRLLTYTINMLVKKIEVVLLLAAGLVLTHRPVLTPTLMVLLLLTNDFLTMSLTTDRAQPGQRPSRWRMRPILLTAAVVGLFKLAFSLSVLSVAIMLFHIDASRVPTLAFAAIAFGNQAVLYVVRERRRMWGSWPSRWLLASSIADLGIVSTLAVSGTLMAPLAFKAVAAVAAASLGFGIALDQIKQPLLAALERR
jgi:H+-transporting ATPase